MLSESIHKTDQKEDPLARATQDFVLLWGEMAHNWGINRTMAQIHALLYASEEPMHTDSVMNALKISRGNASTNLRDLLHWNLVRKVHIKESRRDYYTAEKDVWKIASTVIRERQKRELTPVRENLERCVSEMTNAGNSDGFTDAERQFASRIDALSRLLELFEDFVDMAVPLLESNKVEQVRHIASLASLVREG